VATTGAKFPTLGSSVSATGHNGSAWVGPTLIYANDATSTTDTTHCANITAATFDTGVTSYLLLAQTFDFSAIPDGSTINGVACIVEGWYAAGTANMDLMQLLDTSSAPVGTNQCATPVAYGSLATSTFTKGGAADVWGNALTAAWVKNANFGVALGSIATALNTDIYIDYVTLEVTYTAPSAPTPRWLTMRPRRRK
jgi:hypothetical protein